jgi:RNA chaperone Hfq
MVKRKIKRRRGYDYCQEPGPSRQLSEPTQEGQDSCSYLSLTNGVRLKGVIKGFDNFVILLKENSQSLIYKHAVSTIIPEREIEIVFEDQQ